MMEFVAATVRQREGAVLVADAGELAGEVRQLVRDQVHDVALTLDAALYGHHPGRQDRPLVLLENLRPHDQVRDGGLVVEGDERDCFGRVRPLA